MLGHKQEWAGDSGFSRPARMAYVTGIVNCLVIWEKFKSARAISQLNRYFDVPLADLEILLGKKVFDVDFDASPRVARLIAQFSFAKATANQVNPS